MVLFAFLFGCGSDDTTNSPKTLIGTWVGTSTDGDNIELTLTGVDNPPTSKLTINVSNFVAVSSNYNHPNLILTVPFIGGQVFTGTVSSDQSKISGKVNFSFGFDNINTDVVLIKK
jgi:hypothetical protein